MNTPSILMCRLAELSRAVDETNPEYEPRPNREVTLYSQSVINRVQVLELEHEQALDTIDLIHNSLVDLIEILQAEIVSEQANQCVIDILDLIEEDDLESAITKATPEELSKIMDEIAEDFDK